ncbi:hypothetical protein F5Y05DRAFT_55020 [Hypoxylon sp. FL0543]|nr:hypothetical protein F5Y05DRAFT_55020 [Hypoxylon sp. FL0543]
MSFLCNCLSSDVGFRSTMDLIPRDLSLCLVLLAPVPILFVQWLRVTAERRFGVTLIPIRVLGERFLLPIHLSRALLGGWAATGSSLRSDTVQPSFSAVFPSFTVWSTILPPGYGEEWRQRICRRYISAPWICTSQVFQTPIFPYFSPGTFFGHSPCKNTSPIWYVTTLFTIFHHFWKVGRR